MNCRKCGAAFHIKNSYITVEDGKPFRTLELVCPNKKCTFGRLGIVSERTRREITEPGAADEASKFCCDNLIAYVSNKGYFIPEGVSSSVEDDTLSVICPRCGKTHPYTISGLKPINL